MKPGPIVPRKRGANLRRLAGMVADEDCRWIGVFAVAVDRIQRAEG
jgi:hypothetical protein